MMHDLYFIYLLTRISTSVKIRKWGWKGLKFDLNDIGNAIDASVLFEFIGEELGRRFNLNTY